MDLLVPSIRILSSGEVSGQLFLWKHVDLKLSESTHQKVLKGAFYSPNENNQYQNYDLTSSLLQKIEYQSKYNLINSRQSSKVTKTATHHHKPEFSRLKR